MNCPSCSSSKTVKNGKYKRAGKESQKYVCKDCTYNFTDKEESVDLSSPDSEEYSKSGRYVITSCQSNASTNSGFVKALENYCSHNDSKLLIIPIKYRGGSPNESHLFDKDLEQYFLEGNIRLHKNLMVLGKLKINPTAAQPLSGLDSICQGDSIIVGHNQLQLKTLPVSQDDYPVIMTTTGTVSDEHYSDTKAGYKAEFNHSTSAVVVEVDGHLFHIRQIQWDGEGFYDLNYYYTEYDIAQFNRVEAVVTGDEHAIVCPDHIVRATYTDENSIVKTLRPKIIVRHDLLDCYSISHHHNKNFITRYAKHEYGMDDLKTELDETIEFVKKTSLNNEVNVIISSNHNDHLTRWLNECNPKLDVKNALIYHDLMYRVLKDTYMSDSGTIHPNPFKLYAWDKLYESGVNTFFVERNESYRILDIECSFHGDVGSNGSKGSRLQFSKLPSKTVIGHSHSPGIEKGCYQVGTSSSLQLEYNNGPSSWMNTHCVIYPNGKRTLINIIDGKWRA